MFLLYDSLFLFWSSILFSSLTRRRLYTLNELLRRQAVVTGVYPPPPRYGPLFFVTHRVHSAFLLLVDFHRKKVTHALALSDNQFLFQEKAPTSMHSARLEPTKLVLTGTRTTYQATADALWCYHTINMLLCKYWRRWSYSVRPPRCQEI